MNIKPPNCVYNDNGAWCTNKSVKRSLFGIGARCCIAYGKLSTTDCPYTSPRSFKPKQPPKGQGLVCQH